jgi:hypothetical protein
MLGYDSYGRDELEDMLSKERAKVKELEKKIEDVQATAYAESVDAGMEIRRLNHKYWEDKADEAAKMKRLIYDGKITYRDEYCNEMDWRIMHKVWEDEETKCRSKAEEYK